MIHVLNLGGNAPFAEKMRYIRIGITAMARPPGGRGATPGQLNRLDKRHMKRKVNRPTKGGDRPPGEQASLGDTMHLVYRFAYDGEYKGRLLDGCGTSRDLYNQTLYQARQEFFRSGTFPSYGELDRLMKTVRNLDGVTNYGLLPSGMRQVVFPGWAR